MSKTIQTFLTFPNCKQPAVKTDFPDDNIYPDTGKRILLHEQGTNQPDVVHIMTRLNGRHSYECMIAIYAHESNDNFVDNPANSLLSARFSPCSHYPHARICSNRINRGAVAAGLRDRHDGRIIQLLAPICADTGLDTGIDTLSLLRIGERFQCNGQTHGFCTCCVVATKTTPTCFNPERRANPEYSDTYRETFL